VSELIDLVSNYGFAILLTACALSCLTGLLGVTFGIVMWRKCSAVFALLIQEKDENTRILTELSERHNGELSRLHDRILRDRDQAVIRESETVRQLLNYFATAATGKPLD
jgi:hypothetical protein